jgi:hypothetical protein
MTNAVIADFIAAGRRTSNTRRRLAAMAAVGMALCIGHTGPAFADWAFTKWGMSPEQVAAASNGAIHVLPPGEQKRDEEDHWVIAARGDFKDGDVPLSPGFMFDTRNNGLICVVYGTTGKESDQFLPKLEQRYGKPAAQSEVFSMQTTTWHTPDDIELSVTTNSHAASVMHCQKGR